MEHVSKDPIQDARDRLVPEDLLQKMHDANERLHKARRRIEEAMSESEYSHQGGVDLAAEEVRSAEREVEEINLRIHTSLKPPPTGELRQ